MEPDRTETATMEDDGASAPDAPVATAVVMSRPGRLDLRRLPLDAPGDDDLVVDVEWSGISTGTERLLWEGRMPAFPGMGYPLVPGYESVGRVRAAGAKARARVGQRVFVPGAGCFGPVRGLFGGAASTLVVPQARAVPLPDGLAERGTLLALAATAHHVTGGARDAQPALIVGHGTLGRLLARLALAAGTEPVVWERNPARRDGALGYAVIDPADDTRRAYDRICDASGAADLLDTLLARLSPGGEIVLAGFYDAPLRFDFAPAFLREARLRVAAQWRPADLEAVRAMTACGRLSLDGLITHRSPATDAGRAYRTAFDDPACLKMILDWRDPA